MLSQSRLEESVVHEIFCHIAARKFNETRSQGTADCVTVFPTVTLAEKRSPKESEITRGGMISFAGPTYFL